MNRICLFVLLLSSSGIYAQNVGINTNSPQAALDVYGDVIFRSADLVVGNGTTLALDVNSNRFSYYRISGPTANFSIAGISQAVEGRLLVLFNRSGFTMQINHLDPTAASGNRIQTGTGSNITIPNKAAISLQYDGLEQKWIVKSTGASVGGGGSSPWNISGNDISNSNTGNVGIGTTSPNYKLDINGNASVKGLTIEGVNSPNLLSSSSLSIVNTDDDFTLAFDGNKVQSYVNGVGVGTIPLLLNPGGGSIGVGIPDNPEAGFHLRSESEMALKVDAPNAIMTFNNQAGTEQRGFFRTWTDNPFNPAGYYGFEVGAPPTSVPAQPNRLMFSTNYNLRMVIMENGNVGIGTTNPDPYYKLSVNGYVRAKEIRVNTNWADYVFADSYQLRPLKLVEDFIKENKHLPGIPSAATLQKEGLDLSAMQTKMMEKIEELTLYLIDAEKKIEALQQKIENLEKKKQ